MYSEGIECPLYETRSDNEYVHRNPAGGLEPCTSIGCTLNPDSTSQLSGHEHHRAPEFVAKGRTLTERERIIATSGCATMFSYAAEFASPRDKELLLRKFQYMTNHLFSDLGVTSELFPFIADGNRLTMNNIILQKPFDGGLRYNGAMAACEETYEKLVKATQPRPIQVATIDMSGTQIFELVKPSVWTLLSFNVRAGKPDWEGATQGSAVAVSRNTLLTNCHTLRGHSDRVIMQSDVRYLSVNIASADYITDRCVLKTGNDILEKYVGIRPSVNIDVGEEAYSIGAPGESGEGIMR